MSGGTEWATLAHAVRRRVVAKYLGQLALAMAALNGVPLLVALLYGDGGLALRYTAVVVVLLLFGLSTSRFETPSQIQTNEAWVITTLTFVVGGLAGTVPIMGAGLSALDALFESISAVTTTGLSMVAEPERMAVPFLFGRAWMQWYGGLGIVVLSVALLRGHGMVGRRLLDPGAGENLATSAHFYARRMLMIYLALTMIGTVLILPFSDGFAAAVIHTLAAVSTGGFAMSSDSLAALEPTARALLILYAFLGAVSLPLYFVATQQGVVRLFREPEPRALIAVTLVIVGGLALTLRGQGLEWGDALTHATLMGMSAQSTAGFSSMNPAELLPMGQLLLIVAMFIGGSVGSTAGGVKLFRLLVVVQLLRRLLRRSALPEHGILAARLGDRDLDHEEMERAMIVILLYLMMTGLSVACFIGYGYGLQPALFEVVSALGTVGLSIGLAEPGLPALLKAVLCLDMLAGRVEVFALLVLFYPRSWLGRRREVS